MLVTLAQQFIAGWWDEGKIESGGRQKLGFYIGALMYGIVENIFLQAITEVYYRPMKRIHFMETKGSTKLTPKTWFFMLNTEGRGLEALESRDNFLMFRKWNPSP